VLVRTRQLDSPHRISSNEDSPQTDEGARRPSPELVAALREPPARPLRHVFEALKTDGLMGPTLVVVATAIASMGVLLEAVLLRSVLDVSTLLSRPEQGLAAALLLALFALALLGIEILLASAERRAGRHLETRLRAKFLEKIPRLSDSYFQSRPVSDMLERSHSLHLLRTLPPLAVRVLRITAELVATTVAIAWLDPSVAWLAVLVSLLAASIPLAGSAAMSERDFKVRTHAGALTRFHLDALLGRTAIDAHGAERTIAREHDRLLSEWVRASRALQRTSVIVEGFQLLSGFAISAWILFGYLGAAHDGGTLLLLTYWVLNLPALGYELALAVREYPAHRSTILRVLEPLGAPQGDENRERSIVTPAISDAGASAGVAIAARGASVQVAGQVILENINLDIAPGSHVAVVGTSGAGKSTLVGTLLGWHRVASGKLLVDDRPPVGDALDKLRLETAWVDPSVHIWNQSMLENLLYGSDDASGIGAVLEASGLVPVIAKLPGGLATPLGESGKLLSAGEGQRVRLGRALVRHDARLVLLDEPFLGIERERRRILLAQARQRWTGRTLLYVTHDVSETRLFDRVIVLERGRIVEDGEPRHLSNASTSRYRRLLQAHEAVHARLTTGSEWRRIRLEEGRILQEPVGATLEQRAR
jgi:ATP-binding cassette subfamily B protein